MSELIEKSSSSSVNAIKVSTQATNLQEVEQGLRLALGDDAYIGNDTQESAHHPLAEAFRSFIEARDFPCVGAKAALSRHQLDIIVARDITSTWDDLRIYPLLRAFAQRYTTDPALFQSFAVLFEGPATLTEAEFERHLWARIQSLSHKDDWLGQPADARVSDDPSDPHFSLSFGGEAFFVVGLHPGASRPARRFQTPALVFNLHDQFEMLRKSGVYEKLRTSILTRDEAVAGSINPMLSPFGESSEAKQYSGRIVPRDWECPFSGRKLGTSGDDS